MKRRERVWSRVRFWKVSGGIWPERVAPGRWISVTRWGEEVEQTTPKKEQGAEGEERFQLLVRPPTAERRVRREERSAERSGLTVAGRRRRERAMVVRRRGWGFIFLARGKVCFVFWGVFMMVGKWVS